MMDYAGRAFIDILEKHPNHPQHKYTSNDIDAYDAQEQGIRSCRACRTQPGRETVMMAGAFVVAVVLWVVLEAYFRATRSVAVCKLTRAPLSESELGYRWRMWLSPDCRAQG